MMAITIGRSFVIFLIFLVFKKSEADTRYFLKVNPKDEQKPSTSIVNNTKYEQDDKLRAFYNTDDESAVIQQILKANQQQHNSFIEASTFDPNVLNKFLDEYASKIRSTTDKSDYPFSYDTTKDPSLMEPSSLGSDTSSSEISTSTEEYITVHGSNLTLEQLNDTMKRNKFYNSNNNDNRNGNGWVTLEAIPWSKSKISKWQANANSQRPWNNDNNKWDKYGSSKPWPSDYVSRPPYDNNKSWYDKPKPQFSDFQSDRPIRPSTRPSNVHNYYDSNPGQAQKWPPEKPSSPWDDFSNAHRPHSDIIITDDRPSNFPVSDWDKYDQVTRPTYSSFNDRYDTDAYEDANNWPGSNNNNNNHQHKFDNYDNKPNYPSRPNRPHFSGQYEYENRYPPSHPSSGDGQWVLLSTNRGYSRQRSLKYNANGDVVSGNGGNGTISKLARGNRPDKPDPGVEVVTSKRQVRLTVLPSINGTNTTTSHGGLLEVEKTFKTVEESRREYEAAKLLADMSTSATNINNVQTIIKRRPVTRGVGPRPSNSAVLAAVGAGMLPATMAMMIPIMLGRKKRSLDDEPNVVEFFNKHQ